MKENHEKLAESYMKTYKSQMNSLQKSPLARWKGLNQYDITALGKQLDAFRLHVAICEDDGSVASLGPLPKIGLDVITANFGVSPLPAIAGIQPIDEVQGLVWFKDVVAQNTRGNVTAGQIVSNPLQMPDVFPTNYASASAVKAHAYSASNGAQTGTGIALNGSQDLDDPVNPQTCFVFANAIFNAGADTAVFPTMQSDPVSGNFSSAVKVNGTVYTCFGTVNYTNATFAYQFSADPSGQTDFYISFEVLQEVSTDIPKNILVMQAKPVTARFMALKSTWGFAENYMMQKRWNMNAEAEITRDLTAMVNNEVFNLVLSQIIGNVPSNANVPWGREPGSGVSYYEHIMTLPSALTDASVLMYNNLGRGSTTAYIAGPKACGIMEQHPKFTKMFDDDTLGAHVYGTFDGKPVVRCPSAQLDANTIIGLWKGRNPFEAPVVWAPYMPLTMTETQGTGANPLQRQKACAVWGAVDTMIPNALCSVTIDQSSFNYGAA